MISNVSTACVQERLHNSRGILWTSEICSSLKECCLFPSVDTAFAGVEVHSNQAYRKLSTLELLVVAAVENLADGLIGAPVQLELEDEYRLRRADVCVDAALVRLRLSLYEQSKQAEEYEEDRIRKRRKRNLSLLNLRYFNSNFSEKDDEKINEKMAQK